MEDQRYTRINNSVIEQKHTTRAGDTPRHVPHAPPSSAEQRRLMAATPVPLEPDSPGPIVNVKGATSPAGPRPTPPPKAVKGAKEGTTTLKELGIELPEPDTAAEQLKEEKQRMGQQLRRTDRAVMRAELVSQQKSKDLQVWQPSALQGRRAGGWGSRANGTSRHIQHSPGTPTPGLRERGNNTSRSTGRSGRQKAATRRNMRREERVTVQGPVKKQQPDGMSHGGMTLWACLRVREAVHALGLPPQASLP